MTGPELAFYFLVAIAASSTAGWNMALFVHRRRELRARLQEQALESQFADRAPATFATWPCPDCGDDVPVTFHTQRIVIAHPDPTDIHAHRLTHQEQP